MPYDWSIHTTELRQAGDAALVFLEIIFQQQNNFKSIQDEPKDYFKIITPFTILIENSIPCQKATNINTFLKHFLSFQTPKAHEKYFHMRF